MSKQSSRDKDRDIRLSETQMRHPGLEEALGKKAEDSSGSTSSTSELAEEYHYVVADLRRIGVIALIMVGALIGLALLLP